jgi:phage major head subunit gpT-like protein
MAFTDIDIVLPRVSLSRRQSRCDVGRVAVACWQKAFRNQLLERVVLLESAYSPLTVLNRDCLRPVAARPRDRLARTSIKGNGEIVEKRRSASGKAAGRLVGFTSCK